MVRFRPLLILVCAAAAFGADDPLQATFARMDAVAATFKGLKANIRRVSHLDVINDDTVENGTILVRRTSPKDLRMLLVIESPPNPLKAYIGSGKVQVYYPNSNTVQEWELGKARSLRDQLMTLAFGSSSKELSTVYTIRLVGPEKAADQNATRIELTPRDKELAAHFPKIDLWIADATGITVQQKLYQPGGDYMMATYTDVQLMSVPESAVKLDVPKNAHWERPQKQ
jgi:outer membrane lipoprotein-sorting protein